ncbi:hypothetical protein ACT3SQ_01975 [Brachybacterium sp. AOP42-C2-15]|uniref:hypothetical protein n=1 Tax=unclassified Brachybacterium TaxID=2623841 RepID=UPI003F8F0EE4
MSSEHRPGLDPEHGDAGSPPSFPRLDAEGMLARSDAADADDSARRDKGPSLLLPGLVTLLGLALLSQQLVELIRMAPAEGQVRPMNGPVLAAALALVGFSLTRLLQLLGFITVRRRREAAGGTLREVPWQLEDAHSLHAVWVIGVGASIALMGLLGLWSLLDGRPSGLEPGWPLLLAGGAVALVGRVAWLRTTAGWAESAEES